MRRWLVAASILLIYSAGSWAMAFYQMNQGFLIGEQNKAIVVNEMALAVVFTAFGIVCLIVGLKGKKDVKS